MIKQSGRIVLAIGLLAGSAAAQDKPASKRQIERAKRPTFTERDWDGVYFENLFEQGLVGPRPANFGQKIAGAKPAATPANNEDGGDANSPSGWSEWISAPALEDEVKKAHLELESLVTAPQKFKTENAKARESFSRLATWFGIIAEYDDTVRWKEDAAAARDAFAQAAANARTSSDEAFANVKAQRDHLAELIRGGKWQGGSGAGSIEMDWTHWADRVSLMTRLETAFTERLKPWTSNEDEFSSHLEEMLHEANLVAAIGQAILREGLDDADDDEYQKLGLEMSAAAKALQQALDGGQFDSASSAVNQIGQACSNCHEGFR